MQSVNFKNSVPSALFFLGTTLLHFVAESSASVVPPANTTTPAPATLEKRWWTKEDGDGSKRGMCGKFAPLYNGYYPICNPNDPDYGCCSSAGYCGNGTAFCECEGCVDYIRHPEKVNEEPVKPTGPIRWLTLDQLQLNTPTCGYNAPRLTNGTVAICNPDSATAFCCSAAGYCGSTPDYCACEECVDFKKNSSYVYPPVPLTWITSGPDAGKCGPNLFVNGTTAQCNPHSQKYHCCSQYGYCGSGPEYCTCEKCIDFSKPPANATVVKEFEIDFRGNFNL